jgi:hypothetical protein
LIRLERPDWRKKMEIVVFVGFIAGIGYISTIGAVIASSVWSILAFHVLLITLGVLAVRYARRVKDSLPQVDFILGATFVIFIISAHFG